MKFRFLAATLLLSACAQAQDAKQYPAPVEALLKQGVTIKGELPAPKGYHGYLANYDGHPVPLYVTPDGKYAMAGTLFGSHGEDLTQEPMAAASKPALDASVWDGLGKSAWVAEGAKHPKRIVYVFTDTECPYCHKLWEAIQPLLVNTDVQVRNVIVAVIAPKSESRGAALLDADDPAAALRQHEKNFGHSPLKPLAKVPEDTASRLKANNALMDGLGIAGTPAVIYKDDKGTIRMLGGVPPEAKIKAIFGP